MRRRRSTGSGVNERDCAESDSDDSEDDETSCLSSGGADVDEDMSFHSQGDRCKGTLGFEASNGVYRNRRRQRRGSDDIDGGGDYSDDDFSDTEVDLSRRTADVSIIDSMSVTPSSSVAVGSLMGRSLGMPMSSSFADDGLAWNGDTDDAFFHHDISPSTSPPLEPSIAAHSSVVEATDVYSRRVLF